MWTRGRSVAPPQPTTKGQFLPTFGGASGAERGRVPALRGPRAPQPKGTSTATPAHQARETPPQAQGPAQENRRRKSFGSLCPSWDRFSIKFFDNFCSALKFTNFLSPQRPQKCTQRAPNRPTAHRPTTSNQSPDGTPGRCVAPTPGREMLSNCFPLGKVRFSGRGV